jgi:hypothetical protein
MQSSRSFLPQSRIRFPPTHGMQRSYMKEGRERAVFMTTVAQVGVSDFLSEAIFVHAWHIMIILL